MFIFNLLGGDSTFPKRLSPFTFPLTFYTNLMLHIFANTLQAFKLIHIWRVFISSFYFALINRFCITDDVEYLSIFLSFAFYCHLHFVVKFWFKFSPLFFYWVAFFSYWFIGVLYILGKLYLSFGYFQFFSYFVFFFWQWFSFMPRKNI